MHSSRPHNLFLSSQKYLSWVIFSANIFTRWISSFKFCLSAKACLRLPQVFGKLGSGAGLSGPNLPRTPILGGPPQNVALILKKKKTMRNNLSGEGCSEIQKYVQILQPIWQTTCMEFVYPKGHEFLSAWKLHVWDPWAWTEDIRQSPAAFSQPAVARTVLWSNGQRFSPCLCQMTLCHVAFHRLSLS